MRERIAFFGRKEQIMEGKIKIALAQLASTPLETEKNLQRALQWA